MATVFKTLTRQEAQKFMDKDKGLHRSRAWLARKVSDGTVVDIGCGKGIAVSRLFHKAQYIGVDISPELIFIAKKNNPDYTFYCCDCQKIHFMPNDLFEYTIVRSVLEHTDTIEEALNIYKEAIRIASKTAFISWHTPPRTENTFMKNIKAELDNPIPQNRYAEAPFRLPGLHIEKIRKDESEIWVVRKSY